MEGRRGRRSGREEGHTLLPLRVRHLSNTISCWYCDFKSSALNEPLFHFGRKHARCLRVWFSVGMGFSLTTLVGVTMIIVLESARALHMYNGNPWLSSLLSGSSFGFYSSVFRFSISVADVGYMCISSITSLVTHELGHALAAASEGIQMEYTAVFLAVLFPGALVAFNHELLLALPRLATLRIYCAGIWHNAAFCAVCALTLFLLPLILYPFYIHGESLMVLDVSPQSTLSGYLSPGDLITSLDGKRVHSAEEWMEMTDLLDEHIFQTSNHYSSRKGYCVPNSLIGGSKHIQFIDSQTMCQNELTLFATIPCFDSNTLDDSSDETDHLDRREHAYCLSAKDVLGLNKCGDGWVNIVKNESNCVCSEEESCLTPVQMPGLTWVEITYSSPYSPECRQLANNTLSSHKNSDSGENSCGGTFVFIGDMISMGHSVWLTAYQPRRSFGFDAYLPSIVEKLLMSTFHVSLMLALLNSLPVYYLDGESILEVALCCVSFLTPWQRKKFLGVCLLAGTLISILLTLKIFVLVIL